MKWTQGEEAWNKEQEEESHKEGDNEKREETMKWTQGEEAWNKEQEEGKRRIERRRNENERG